MRKTRTEEIPGLIKRLTNKYRTSEPYGLSECLNVTILNLDLGERVCGYYKYLKRRKYIFINSNIENDDFRKVIISHELGHAVMHKNENCTFMRSHTLLLTSKVERQANMFAAYLLISDDMLHGYAGCTQDQFCTCTGYPKELIELRLR